MADQSPPFFAVHLLPVINRHLLDLLHSLKPADWARPTVARLWTIKDVVAHLLDGNIRVLSMLRDGYYSDKPTLEAPGDLLDHLNRLNADWVKAMKRVSPAMLILMHETTGDLYNEYYANLDPYAPSTFAVNWAGETKSLNWMHIAREYTEKWLHQQQVRAAVNDEKLLCRELYYPVLDIFMRALPYTFRDVVAPNGTTVQMTISGEAGGSWHISSNNASWILQPYGISNPTAEVIIDAKVAWKLFSKSIRPQEVTEQYNLKGDERLGQVALSMVSVMA